MCEDTIQKLQAVFNSVDKDKDGYLGISELAQVQEKLEHLRKPATTASRACMPRIATLLDPADCLSTLSDKPAFLLAVAVFYGRWRQTFGPSIEGLHQTGYLVMTYV